MQYRFAALALSVLAAAADAGTVVHVSTQTSSHASPVAHEVYYAQDGLLRVDTLDDEGHVKQVSLVRDGALWEIDVANHTYRKLDNAAMLGGQAAMDERMQAMLARMPPDKRALMQQRMQQMQQPVDLTWNDTGRTEASGPYSCRVWDLRRSDKLLSEYCVTPAASLPGGDELSASMRAASAVATAVLAGSKMAAGVAQRLSVFTKMNGFPVLTRTGSEQQVVTAIERAALPADKFAIPKGFTPATDAGRL